jgi:hypothetical protein
MTRGSNRARYLVSLGEELTTQANRVRDLIGDAHWLSDGHHKEYLLSALLTRHLPIHIKASRGFIVAASDSNKCSTEQDILLTNGTREGPIFDQGGLVISFPGAVAGVLSVKTKFAKQALSDAITGVNTVRSIAALEGIDTRRIWCGVFFFESSSFIESSPLEAVGKYMDEIYLTLERPNPILQSPHPQPVGPDLICVGPSLIFKIDHEKLIEEGQKAPTMIRAYRANKMATALLLADLMAHITPSIASNDLGFEDLADSLDLEVIGRREVISVT